jgi:hypothetical protein
LNRSCHSETFGFSMTSPPYASGSITQLSLASLPNLTQNLMLIHYSKSDYWFLRWDVETHALSAPQFPHKWRYYIEIVTDASWNMRWYVLPTIKTHSSISVVKWNHSGNLTAKSVYMCVCVYIYI